LDVARCRQVFNHDEPDWIAFTAADAKWVSFTVDPRLVSTFGELGSIRCARFKTGTADGSAQLLEQRVCEWMNRAESLLHEWVVRAILQSEKRAARFRSLGRGWIFIQLSSNGVRHAGGKALDASEHRTRFKWWFEGVERMVRNRSAEFTTSINLPADEVDKWLYGYSLNSELVFAVRGFAPRSATMSRCKMNEGFCKGHVWSSTEQVYDEVRAPFLSEETREQMAIKHERERERRRAKKERQKVNKRTEKEREKEEREETERREASTAFDALLEELKLEEKETHLEAS